MALQSVKAWELRYEDVVVIKGENYTLTDDPKPGPPGWTRVTTKDRGGLLTIHMIEGTDTVLRVYARDYTDQIESARRKGNR